MAKSSRIELDCIMCQLGDHPNVCLSIGLQRWCNNVGVMDFEGVSVYLDALPSTVVLECRDYAITWSSYYEALLGVGGGGGSGEW
ncbi:unnamed protein product [Prunus armeniaca]